MLGALQAQQETGVGAQPPLSLLADPAQIVDGRGATPIPLRIPFFLGQHDFERGQTADLTGLQVHAPQETVDRDQTGFERTATVPAGQERIQPDLERTHIEAGQVLPVLEFPQRYAGQRQSPQFPGQHATAVVQPVGRRRRDTVADRAVERLVALFEIILPLGIQQLTGLLQPLQSLAPSRILAEPNAAGDALAEGLQGALVDPGHVHHSELAPGVQTHTARVETGQVRPVSRGPQVIGAGDEDAHRQRRGEPATSPVGPATAHRPRTGTGAGRRTRFTARRRRGAPGALRRAAS